MTYSLLPILPVVDDVLFNFAQSDEFWANLAIAFGTSYDVVKATQLRQQWHSRNFSQIPPIEVLSDEVLGTANGAYSRSTNKIYLSASFLNTASPAAIINVILEEIGHYVDAQINQNDAPGDEGEYFSALVRGVDLTTQEVARITTENDFANITITGSNISVEKSAPIILTVNTTADQNDGTTTGGLSLRDAILIANADTTNDYIIELQGGQTYFLTNMVFGDLWDNTAKTGDLDILPGGKVTIKSLGTSQAVIDGSGLGSGYGKGNRIFHVLANSNFSLDKITITKSAVGGILVDQNALANISNSIITQNVYVSMSGGSASTRGGGISNFGNTIIQSSTINQNSSGHGGGIYNEGSLTINDSTINENNSTYDGGGIYSSGTLTVTNSVVNSNKTGFNGGGFYNGGTANISKTAFNNNNDTGIYNTGSLTLTDGSINSNLSAGLENKGTTTVTGTSINSNTGNGIENNNILNISRAIINQNGKYGLYNSPDLFGSNNKYANVESTIIDRNGDTGIYNSGTINISKSVVSSNADGGLYNNSGNATVIDTIIQNNITTGFGGGIDNRTANLTVINSLIDGNSATKYGGGIYNYNDTLHNVTIVNSTISNNSASFGGGILNTGYTVPGSRNVPPRDTRATFTAINLTISGNSASGSGGGIYNESRGNLNLSNNTITNNTSTSNFNTSGGTGGGIYNEINGGLNNNAKGVVNAKNTIIAGNFDTPNNSVTSSTLNPDLYGPINGDNNNLIGNLSGASGSVGTGTDLVNPNPKLGPLQNNGGITLTHAVLSNSPAINKGNNLLVPLDSMDIDGDGNKTEQIPFDQRGTGFSRIIGGTVDIGAFEEQQTFTITPIEAFGNTKLVQDTTNNLYAQIGNNNPTAIKIGATQITTNIYPGWQTLAAETVNGVNQVLWKYNDGNYLHLWTLDSNWNWQSSSGWWGLNSSEAFTQETNFQQDFNGDGIIGSPYTTIEAFGNTKLVQDTTNKLYTQIGNNNPIVIKNGATQITTNIYPGWQTLAAETVNGVNQILWKYNDGNYLHLWSLDNNWNWQSSSGWWGLNSTEAFTQETNFQQDFNGDGIIGSPYTTIEAFGNTKLVQDTTNKLYTQIGNNNPTAIKIGATQITTNSYSGWQTLAAETVNGVNQVLWKYNDSNHLHLWSLDSNWNWQSSSGWWGLNSTEAFTQETNFQQDFNGDNQIGNPLPNIASSLAVSANFPEPIIGSSNDDILTGTLDNDILVGGLGNDTITGGAGGDNFTFNNLNEGIDTITDFLSSQGDKITLSAAGFGGGLAAETAITAEQFVLGTTALNASNRLIYNTITGDLFFDGDGTGTIAAIQIATLSSKPTLTASDILVLV
jgi:hypothetical protein